MSQQYSSASDSRKRPGGSRTTPLVALLAHTPASLLQLLCCVSFRCVSVFQPDSVTSFHLPPPGPSTAPAFRPLPYPSLSPPLQKAPVGDSSSMPPAASSPALVSSAAMLPTLEQAGSEAADERPSAEVGALFSRYLPTNFPCWGGCAFSGCDASDYAKGGNTLFAGPQILVKTAVPLLPKQAESGTATSCEPVD
jgi:hypothetical protein